MGRLLRFARPGEPAPPPIDGSAERARDPARRAGFGEHGLRLVEPPREADLVVAARDAFGRGRTGRSPDTAA